MSILTKTISALTRTIKPGAPVTFIVCTRFGPKIIAGTLRMVLHTNDNRDGLCIVEARAPDQDEKGNSFFWRFLKELEFDIARAEAEAEEANELFARDRLANVVALTPAASVLNDHDL